MISSTTAETLGSTTAANRFNPAWSAAAAAASSSAAWMPNAPRMKSATSAYGVACSYEAQRAVMRSTCGGSAFRNSATRRDFPTPGSPTIAMTDPCPARARSRARLRTASSASRPTNRVASGSIVVSSSRTTRYVTTGSVFPFSTIGSRRSNSNRCIASRRVVSLTSTWPRGAADSKRCAVLTASPTTVYARWTSPASRPATTSPVFTPIRSASRTPYVRSRSSFRWRIDACIASAAWIARSASSSCEIGAPNTAMTASPMYLSIDLPRERAEVAAEDRPQLLRVELLRERRRAGEIREEDGHDLPLLEERLVRLGGDLERGARRS